MLRDELEEDLGDMTTGETGGLIRNQVTNSFIPTV